VCHLMSAMAAIMLAGLCSVEAPPPNTGPFEPAEIVSATDLAYPIQSVAVGTVVLEITVSEKGAVEDVWPIREIQSLTETAVKSVRKWQFKPALLDGQPTRSRTVVAVTFNPAGSLAHNEPLPPLSATEPSSRPVLEPGPVTVVAASFPQYPVNSVTTGTVVIRVIVDSEGRVENTEAIRDIASLTAPCIRALEEWKFEPAQFRGKPIRSSIALAFVLRPRPPRN
jgi:TonB family protein